MKIISKLAGVTVLALAIGATAAVAEEKVMVYAGSGGTVKDSIEKIFVPPFTKETGIRFDYVAAESDVLPQMEAMSKAGTMLWDAAELSADAFPNAVKRGLLEKIDYSLADPKNELPPEAKREYGIVYASYSDVLVQRLDKNPAGKKMTSWKDFWDVKTFPGPRSLYKSPEYNLEFALLADGVEPSKLYDVLGTEEGLDRAFHKLDEIKPYIPVWWESGAQSVQLLSDGEVFYSTTYNGRVNKLKDSGIPAEIVWNGGALHLTMIGIPKGAPHPAEAYAYLKFRNQRPDLASEYVKVLPYPDFTHGLFERMDPALAKTMPTYPANAAVQFVPNEDWWADHLDQIQERFDEWLLK